MISANTKTTESASAPFELPPRRVILLGASNLTRGIATVVDACHRLWGGPLDLLAALGHGRSYGATSRVLGRRLPGILQCGIWSAARARPQAPTAALVTDIGNDLLYESSVDTIARWVTQSLDELLALDARIVMTRLPIGNIEGLAEWKFRMLRRVMFPKGRLPLSAIAERARELDARLVEAATARRIQMVELTPEWYGFDPIHIKPSCWPTAWHEILRRWSDAEDAPTPARGGWDLRRWLYLLSLAPEQRSFLGKERHCQQPCGKLSEGTVVSYY
ncbi:MAG TPA: hypothetical protein VGJ26_02320 [Pirellulales bacterium]|jgi:hypothetical protein